MKASASRTEWLIKLAFWTMPFMSVTPQQTPIATSIFISALLALTSIRIQSISIGGNRSFLPSIAFLIIVIFSLPIAYINGVRLEDWFLRGSMPYFFFFLILFSIPAKNAEFVIKTIVQSSIIWAIYVLFQIFESSEYNIERFTYITKDLLIPYNLVGIPLVLFCEKYFGRKYQIFVVSLLLVMTFISGYRSHLAITLFMVALYFMREFGKGRLVIPLVVGGVGVLLFSYFLATAAGQDLMARISDEMSADLGRPAEIAFAIEKFQSSPVFGVGLGTPIPPTVTFYGRESYARGLMLAHGFDYNVTYMHNIVFYILMNLGAAGLAAYCWMIFRSIIRVPESHLDYPERFGVIMALASILVFTLVAATFTLIQWQVLFACLIGVLGSSNSKRSPSARKRRFTA